MLRVVALAALVGPGASVAQDGGARLRIPPHPPAYGMVLDEGEWRAPTPEDALRVLGDPGVANPSEVGLAVLRQKFEARPAVALDALANELADILLSGDPEFLSAEHEAGSFDALVRVYEVRAARALAEGGTDPFVEEERRLPVGSWRLGGDLWSIYRVDPAGRGGEYLLDLLESAEVPEPHQYNHPASVLWCEVVNLLRGNVGDRCPARPQEGRLTSGDDG